MRQPAIAVLAAALLAVPAVQSVATRAGSIDASASATIRPQPRGSILIEGNDEFTRENGVRSGSGTAEDPYVISNWTILQNAPYGIHIENTTASLVLEHIDVVTTPAASSPCLEPQAAPGHKCLEYAGIHLRNVTNVDVEAVRVVQQQEGITVEDSGNVTISRSRFGDPGFETTRPATGFLGATSSFRVAMIARDSQNLVVENVTAANALTLFASVRSDRVTVRDASFLGSYPESFVSVIGGASDVRFVRTNFSKTALELTEDGGPVDRLSLLYNRFEVGDQGITEGTGDSTDYQYCGNTFTNIDRFAPGRMDSVTNGTLEGNRIIVNDGGGLVVTNSINVSVRRNLVHEIDSELPGVAIDAVSQAQVHNNSFDNANGVKLEGSTPEAVIDASWNWWGDASGPNRTDGAPNGSGEQVETLSNVTLTPWLTDPPEVGPDAVDCGVPQGPAGVKQGPPARVFGPVDVEARVGVDGVNARLGGGS